MIKKIRKTIFFSILCILVFLFQFNSQTAQATLMNSDQDKIVIEELRLKVPSQYKEVWWNIEKRIWDPWLSSKNGFLGRQLFWNKKKEEGLILVNWESKNLWKSISMKEVYDVQEKYEEYVKTSLNLNENPFELIYEGELQIQE